MTERHPIVVASALDPAGDEALRQGAAIAAARGAPLVVCHVLPEVFGHRPLFPHLREEDRRVADDVRRVATGALEQQCRRVLGDGGPAPALRLEAGSPHGVLLELAERERAGLVVVGAAAPGAGDPLGGVAERIVRHAHCPVLVARAVHGDRVVAATDFSDAALPAIEAGAAEAARRGLPLVMLHVVEPFVITFTYPEASHSPLLPLLLEARGEEARARLAALRGRFPGETLLVRGRAAPAILAATEGPTADLVVVGTHGRTGVRRLALGSVAESVLRRARCSVMVVRLHG